MCGKRLCPVYFALFSTTTVKGFTRESATRAVLEELGLLGHSFPRSLLPPDAVPLPEDMAAWLKGRPGTTIEYVAFIERMHEAHNNSGQGDDQDRREQSISAEMRDRHTTPATEPFASRTTLQPAGSRNQPHYLSAEAAVAALFADLRSQLSDSACKRSKL